MIATSEPLYRYHDQTQDAASAERRQCVGMVLAAIGRARLRHQHEVVEVLEALATRMEQAPCATK